MSDQPKPATVKWTVEGKAIWNNCEAVGIAESGKEAKIIAEAHNAALAAEMEKYENATDNLYRDIKRLNQQLSAERKSEGKLRVLLATELERRQAAEQQLAAERDERAIVERSRDAWKAQTVELAKTLAAEREKP